MRKDVVRKGKFLDKETGEVLPVAQQDELKGIRNTFKAVKLGVGFGMGYDKLALSITKTKINSLPKDKLDIVKQSLISDDAIIKEEARRILKKITVYSGTEQKHEKLKDEQKATTYKGYHQEVFRVYGS